MKSFRKYKDLYLWISRCPSEPSVKFLVDVIHEMEELKLTMSQINGSQPILTFSSDFELQPYWKLLKNIMTGTFYICSTLQGNEKNDHDGLDKMTLI